MSILHTGEGSSPFGDDPTGSLEIQTGLARASSHAAADGSAWLRATSFAQSADDQDANEE